MKKKIDVEKIDARLRKMSTPRLKKIYDGGIDSCCRISDMDKRAIASITYFHTSEILRNRQRRKRGECTAKIHHGPGHQSHTYCWKRGPHKVHEIVYGEFDQIARWTKKEVFSGYFDEPPRGTDALGDF